MTYPLLKNEEEVNYSIMAIKANSKVKKYIDKLFKGSEILLKIENQLMPKDQQIQSIEEENKRPTDSNLSF